VMVDAIPPGMLERPRTLRNEPLALAA
jgi:hypothetical protein